jgi:hypothetical protein
LLPVTVTPDTVIFCGPIFTPFETVADDNDRKLSLTLNCNLFVPSSNNM